MNYVAGLDLGQASDSTALAILERQPHARAWAVRHLERAPLGTSYVDIVERVRSLVGRPPLRGNCQLVVDATGVGRPVLDLLRQARLGCRMSSVLIHGGDDVSLDRAQGTFRVPKRDLIAVVQVLLQQRRLKISPELPEADVLAREMRNFRVRISLESGHDSYAPWRSGDHDDLVLAVAMAAWVGQRNSPLPAGPPEPERQGDQRVRELFEDLERMSGNTNPDLFAVPPFPSAGWPRTGGQLSIHSGPVGPVIRIVRGRS